MVRIRLTLSLAAILLATWIPAAVQAQTGGGGGGGGIGGNFQNAGVIVDAQGVLRVKRVPAPRGLEMTRIREAAMTKLTPELMRPTALRKISLTRLEKVLAEQLARGESVSEEMKYLAGMQRIQYVFFYPDTGDIVIAGPAEGFAEDNAGRVRGLNSGRPVLELQDLAVALRAYPPGRHTQNVIGVSIDPTQEGLARMRQFHQSIAGRVRPGDAVGIAQGMRDSLGLQTVRIDGVSPRTHFAQVLVEADYRMKLIGIELEQPPVKIASYVARANPRGVGRNALQRWYFTPDYKCLRVAENGMALEMVGLGVRLVSEAELVQEGGIRVQNSVMNKASAEFCKNFTDQYPNLAGAEPVYAQLRNLIDMSVVAAFIQNSDFYSQANWDLGVLGREQSYPVETYETPTQVESAVNVVWKRNVLMTPIGGGVVVEPHKAIGKTNLIADETGAVTEAQGQVSLDKLAEGQWWWD